MAKTKTKTKTPNLNARHFNDEADRYCALANELAMQMFQQPQHADFAKRKRLAEDHLIRAEVWRTAARMCE